MSEFEQTISILGPSGDAQEVRVSLDDYAEASRAGISLGQLYAQKYPTNAGVFGSPLEQMMAATGTYISSDRRAGISSPTLSSLFDTGTNLSAITRPDGSLNRTPAGRFFFPAVVLEVIQSSLETNHSKFLTGFNNMIALRRDINQPRYDQVIIDTLGPRSGTAQPIGQLQSPARILSIRTSDTQKTIPQYAVGMEISDQALQAASLDLVSFAMREFMLQERVDVVKRDIAEFVNGSVDSGQTALPSVTAQSFDPAIVTAGTLTQKAWVKFLYEEDEIRTITDVIVSGIDVALAIQDRINRPTMLTDTGTDERWNTTTIIGPGGIPASVNIFVLKDTSILGANTMVGLDRSRALRKITYVGAAYQAVQDFIMSRKQSFRTDWAERVEQAGYRDAFSKMTLTV